MAAGTRTGPGKAGAAPGKSRSREKPLPSLQRSPGTSPHPPAGPFPAPGLPAASGRFSRRSPPPPPDAGWGWRGSGSLNPSPERQFLEVPGAPRRDAVGPSASSAPPRVQEDGPGDTDTPARAVPTASPRQLHQRRLRKGGRC